MAELHKDIAGESRKKIKCHYFIQLTIMIPHLPQELAEMLKILCLDS